MSSGIVWQSSPKMLARAAEAWGIKLNIALVTLAQFFAQKMQDEARRGAPWEDRTGNARSGLFGEVEMAAARDGVTIYLSHGMVEYGKWLELANAGKYAIIMPTIERNLPEIERQLKRLLA